MPVYTKQDKPNDSGEHVEVPVHEIDMRIAEKKQKRYRSLILLLLLFMIIGIAQVFVLLTSSAIYEDPDPVSVNDTDISYEDIKVVNEDLKGVMDSLENIDEVTVVEAEANEAVVEQPVADVDEVDSPAVVPPPVVERQVETEPVKKPVESKLAVLTPISSSTDAQLPDNREITEEVEKLSGYIKHDSDGKVLADNTDQWTCVHDTGTGLMWEVKSSEDDMRKAQNLYSWYDPEHQQEPGKADGGRCQGDSDCDTSAYIQAMNERNYCGHNDWHLPTREQMQTLVDRRNVTVTIDKRYFPNTVPSWYWTSSDEDNKEDFAWYVLFRNGFALSDLKERPKHIRLVRKTASIQKTDSDI